jgi:hypothetical protein
MIGTTLNYIRTQLDAHLRAVQGLESDDGTQDQVAFLEGDKLDSLVLPSSRIAMLVVNVQEDRDFRAADRFQRRLPDGNSDGSPRHYPDIHLEIAVLFVANFKDYASAWNQLFHVVCFFQQHPVFEEGLPDGIHRLSSELCSQSFQEQNELWSALRSTLRPAVLHRFRLITLQGGAMEVQAPPIDPERVEFRVFTSPRAADDLPAVVFKGDGPTQKKDSTTTLRSPPPP